MNDLTIIEKSSLDALEATITQGKETFIAVGLALCRIRDERLYRATHGSFQCYCEERWNFSRVQAYRLIEAANVVSVLPIGYRSSVTTESQARELARIDPDQRGAVVSRVAAAGKVTAKTIRTAAASVVGDKDRTDVDKYASQLGRMVEESRHNASPDDQQKMVQGMEKAKVRLANSIATDVAAGGKSRVMQLNIPSPAETLTSILSSFGKDLHVELGKIKRYNDQEKLLEIIEGNFAEYLDKVRPIVLRLNKET